MQIDEIDEHRNAEDSITESREPGSNVTFERAAHSRKQFLPSSCTEEGVQIDERGEQPWMT
jgi:hypothetical protein